jgi:hypothetical protein
MAEYYKNRTCGTSTNTVNVDMETDGGGDAIEMSEFDKHRETLLMDDAKEGWASELRRYLGTMQRDVKKETDLVEWWQVNSFVYHDVTN